MNSSFGLACSLPVCLARGSDGCQPGKLARYSAGGWPMGESMNTNADETDGNRSVRRRQLKAHDTWKRSKTCICLYSSLQQKTIIINKNNIMDKSTTPTEERAKARLCVHVAIRTHTAVDVVFGMARQEPPEMDHRHSNNIHTRA